MAVIKNSTERAGEIVGGIERVAANLKIADATEGQNACVNVSAEEECESGYTSGQSFAGKLQEHVLKAGNYMHQISGTLDQADQSSVVRSQHFC